MHLTSSQLPQRAFSNTASAPARRQSPLQLKIPTTPHPVSGTAGTSTLPLRVDAALGLASFMQCDEATLHLKMTQGAAAIVDEVTAHGSEEVSHVTHLPPSTT